MSDEISALEASKIVRELFAAHAPANARDIIRCLASSYLVWLGTTHGREAIDDLMRQEVERHLRSRTHEKSLRLVVSNSAEIVHRPLAS